MFLRTNSPHISKHLSILLTFLRASPVTCENETVLVRLTCYSPFFQNIAEASSHNASWLICAGVLAQVPCWRHPTRSARPRHSPARRPVPPPEKVQVCVNHKLLRTNHFIFCLQEPKEGNLCHQKLLFLSAFGSLLLFRQNQDQNQLYWPGMCTHTGNLLIIMHIHRNRLTYSYKQGQQARQGKQTLNYYVQI